MFAAAASYGVIAESDRAMPRNLVRLSRLLTDSLRGDSGGTRYEIRSEPASPWPGVMSSSMSLIIDSVNKDIEALLARQDTIVAKIEALEAKIAHNLSNLRAWTTKLGLDLHSESGRV